MACLLALLNSDAPPTNYFGWILLAVVAALGLVVGLSDVRRFAIRRVWALSGVCFTESMRRRVLLVTPLAIAGVVVVAQLQQAADDQDAIRQTIKFCLFASGLVVTVTAIILACTNLPREIENRVIYTIVTKPTTRLEIVLGKILGFARVSAMILLVMGLFTYVYLLIRNHNRVVEVQRALAVEPAGSATRTTLSHYASNGFLETKSLEFPDGLAVYSRPPSEGRMWMRGGEPQYFQVPFVLGEDEQSVLAAAAQQKAEVDLILNLDLKRHPLSEAEDKMARQMGLTSPGQANPLLLGPELPSPQPKKAAPSEFPGLVRFRILSEDEHEIVRADDVNPQPLGVVISKSPDGRPDCVVQLTPKVCDQLARIPHFLIEVNAVTPGVEYGAGPLPVVILIPAANNGAGLTLKPPLIHGSPAPPRFSSRSSRSSGLLTGHADGQRSVAIYPFHNARTVAQRGGKVGFQLDVKFEKNGDFTADSSSLSIVAIDVVNQKSGRSSGTIQVTPDVNRTTFFDVPAEDVAGGDFEVRMQDLTPGQWIDISSESVALVAADRTFVGNLAKSLLLLWMLSVLVVSIAVFCSTFLSWPIAIVLTIVVLLGHWGVAQLGDSLNPGVGRLVSSDFRVLDPTESKVVSSSVEAMAKILKTLSVALPDVSQFPATDDIQRGVSIPLSTLLQAIEALTLYGLTLAIAGYVILKYKEVAP